VRGTRGGRRDGRNRRGGRSSNRACADKPGNAAARLTCVGQALRVTDDRPQSRPEALRGSGVGAEDRPRGSRQGPGDEAPRDNVQPSTSVGRAKRRAQGDAIGAASWEALLERGSTSPGSRWSRGKGGGFRSRRGGSQAGEFADHFALCLVVRAEGTTGPAGGTRVWLTGGSVLLRPATRTRSTSSDGRWMP